MTWDQRVTFQPEEYLDITKRNFIPLHTAAYREIRRHPEMAMTHRCCPLSYYYMTVAQESPGYQSRSPTLSEQPRGEQVSNRPHPNISSSRTQPNRNVTSERTTREVSLKDGTVTIRRPDRQARRLVKSPDPSSPNEEERTLNDNYKKEIKMLEDNTHTEQYIAGRKSIGKTELNGKYGTRRTCQCQ
jgi:hypothetical protein